MSLTAPSGNGHKTESEGVLLSGTLTEIGIRAQAALDQLNAERDGVIETLRKLDQERSAFKRVLTAINPANAPGRKKGSPVKPKYSGAKPTTDLISRIEEGIKALGKEEFTILEVYEQNGGTNPKMAASYYPAFALMRKVEYVGKVGKDPINNRHIYRVLDADAVERLKDG